VAAVKRYNNVQLDGKPMKIEIIGTNVSAPVTGSAPAKTTGFGGAPRRCVV
jgi:THO complex subunit 4